MLIVLFIILGLISGLIGGLLGVSGGVIVVPALYFLFREFSTYSDHVMQIAIGTSLACGFITSLSSTFFHILRKSVSISILKFLVPGLIVGSLLGAELGHHVSSDILSMIFGTLSIIIGLYFCFPKLKFFIAKKPNMTLFFFAPSIGLLSSLLGIGGGIVTFPILLGYQVPIEKASANSSATTMFSTLLASLSYMWITWNEPTIPHTFAYIEFTAFLSIAPASIITSAIGVRLAHTLNVLFIKRIFGISLALVGISMLILS